jgi:hypothetical protein
MKHKFWVVHVGAKTIYVMKYRDQKLTKVDLYDGNSMNDDTYIKDYRAGRPESSRATMIEQLMIYSAIHFSHFLAYLSSSWDKSRMTKVKTTLAKNSEERLSLASTIV